MRVELIKLLIVEWFQRKHFFFFQIKKNTFIENQCTEGSERHKNLYTLGWDQVTIEILSTFWKI